jgi:hypothetical protein
VIVDSMIIILDKLQPFSCLRFRFDYVKMYFKLL